MALVNKKQERHNHTVSHILYSTIILIALFSINSFLLYKVKNEITYKKAISLYMQSNYSLSLKELKKVDKHIYSVDPLMNHINQLEAILYSKLNLNKNSLEKLKEIENTMHYFPFYRYNLALAYIKENKLKEAQIHLNYCKEQIPNSKELKSTY